MKKWRLFAQWTGESLEIVLGASVLMAALVGHKMLGGKEFAAMGFPASYLPVLAVYILLLSLVIAPIVIGSAYSGCIQVGITLNMRRKDALLGIQGTKVLSSLAYVLLAVILMWMAGWPLSEGKAWPVLHLAACVLCMDLILISIGEVIVLLYQRYRKWGVFIMMVFFAPLGAFVGAFLAGSVKNGLTVTVDFTAFRIPVWLVALTLAIWALDVVISKKLLDAIEIHS